MKTRRETQQDANWGGIPSLTELWLEALLRRAAMYLVSLASFFGMRPSRLVGECHTDATPQALPQSDSDPTSKETNEAAQPSSQTIVALILSSERSSRPSKDEGGLTAACNKLVEEHRDSLGLPPLIPAKAGTQGRRQGLSRLKAAAAIQNKGRPGSWMPTFVGTSGETAPL